MLYTLDTRIGPKALTWNTLCRLRASTLASAVSTGARVTLISTRLIFQGLQPACQQLTNLSRAQPAAEARRQLVTAPLCVGHQHMPDMLIRTTSPC